MTRLSVMEEQVYILRDVVAYVEVRSGSDNRSAAISQELRQLGAKVEPTFTDAVTHVVFKEGTKRTWSKAVKRKVPIVSVSWIDSCKQNQKQVSEKDFNAVLPEEICSPLPRIHQTVRWKKMKSMQPCDFEEEVARSAERGEKRRRRKMQANKFMLTEETTPTSSSPVHVLAFETQARFPMVSVASRTSSPVPDTPPSMQERLEKMRREQRRVLNMALDDSPPSTPKGPGEKFSQKRLIDVLASDLISTGSSNEEDEASSKTIVKLIESLDSNSEQGSQSSQNSGGNKFSASEKSVKDSSLVNSPNQRASAADQVSKFRSQKCEAKVVVADKETTVPSNKQDLNTSMSSHDCDRSPTEISIDQSVSAFAKGRLSTRKFPKNVENRNRKSEPQVSLFRESKRLSMAWCALSLKDTNVCDLSLNFDIKDPKKTFRTSDSPPQSRLLKRFINVDSSLKSSFLTGENLQGENNIQSSEPAKDDDSSNADDSRKTVVSQLKQLKSGRDSKQKLSNNEIQSEILSKLDCESGKSTSLRPENNEKLHNSATDAASESTRTLQHIPEGSSVAQLKPKTTRKKRNLFTDIVLTTSLPHPADTASINGSSSEESSSHKPQHHFSDLDARSDVSFMFGESKPKMSKRENQTRRRSERINGTKSSLNDTSGLQNGTFPRLKIKKSNDCLPEISMENCSLKVFSDKSSLSLGESVSQNYVSTSMSVAYEKDVSSLDVVRTGSSRQSLAEFRTSSITGWKKAKETSTSSMKTGNKNETKPKKKFGTRCGKPRANRRQNMQNQRRKSSSVNSISDGNTLIKKQKSQHVTSGTEAVSTLNESSSSHAVEVAPASLRHAQSLIMEQKFRPFCKKSAYSLVVTSFHKEEQAMVYSIVKKLGIFHITNDVEATSTHVVCGEPRRTLNVVRAIARGCWLLRKEWVLESLEAGEWLQEESYEVTYFPAAGKSRCDRQNAGPGYKIDLFSKLGAIFVSTLCTPPRKELVHLINLCGGNNKICNTVSSSGAVLLGVSSHTYFSIDQRFSDPFAAQPTFKTQTFLRPTNKVLYICKVTGSETRASIHLGDNHNPTKLVIKPAWVLDCIMKLEALPTDDYIVSAQPLFSQREHSPEF